MRDLFTRRAAPGRAGLVKAWVSEHLNLEENDLLTVAELTCHEPDCPPVETLVTLHKSSGSRKTWRVHKSLTEIGKEDIAAALREDAGQ